MEPQSESPISNERWLSAKLQAIRDALVAPDAEDIEAIDELAVTLLSTVTAGRNAVMFFMAKQDQPGNVSALIAAIARVALGLSVATVPVDPALSGAEFADRLFNRSLGFIASPTKDSSLETFPPASPNTPNSAGADSRYLSATSLKTSPVSPRSIFFDRSPTSPRRNQPPSGARPSLVPGISRKYSVGVASGRKLPGVVILENFQAASKDIQGFVADVRLSRVFGLQGY